MCILKFQFGDLFEFFLCSKYSLENSTWILYTDTTTGRWEAWQTLGCPPMPPLSLKSPHSPPPPLKSPRGPPRPLTAGPNLPASLQCVLFRPTATRAHQFPPSILLGFKVYLPYVHFLAKQKRSITQDKNLAKLRLWQRKGEELGLWTFLILDGWNKAAVIYSSAET